MKDLVDSDANKVTKVFSTLLEVMIMQAYAEAYLSDVVENQWYYNMPSAEIIKKIPVDFLLKAYNGLHDLDLDLAVKKVGVV